jgi:hypothetical protein
VFDAVAGSTVGDAAGRAAWAACSDVDALPPGPVPMLDDELKGQAGAGGEGAVAILPTVRINGKQYRGSLEAGSVLRAICAAFPSGGEPPVCVEAWVSGEDECAPGGEGARACGAGSGGKTKCVNTFRGFECDCGDGFMKVKDQVRAGGGCSRVGWV